MLMILQAPYQSRFYLGAEDPIDPGGKMICQLRKYLEKVICKCYYTLQRQNS